MGEKAGAFEVGWIVFGAARQAFLWLLCVSEPEQ